MGLSLKTAVNIEQIDGYKLFSINENGQLQSAFEGCLKQGLVYTPNVVIEVDSPNARFFCFEKMKDALSVLAGGKAKWWFAENNNEFIVLPVRMIDVDSKGKFIVHSDDPQCMDADYPAFESKRIIVFDSEENRRLYDLENIKNWFYMTKYSLKPSIKRSLIALIPELSEAMKV